MPTEKESLEINALTNFSESLGKEIGFGRFSFKELRKPPEPDSLCLLDGSPLYVEVCHIYGTESDTKRLLGRTGKSAASKGQRMRSALTPLVERILDPLNTTLVNKSTKNYSSSPVWLLIRSAFPLWNTEDFKSHKKRILVPASHPFEQIWMLCGAHRSAGVLRLA
jgi:hypothetical protein